VWWLSKNKTLIQNNTTNSIEVIYGKSPNEGYRHTEVVNQWDLVTPEWGIAAVCD